MIKSFLSLYSSEQLKINIFKSKLTISLLFKARYIDCIIFYLNLLCKVLFTKKHYITEMLAEVNPSSICNTGSK